MKEKKNSYFRNWAGNERCRPARFLMPETEEEIIVIVREAAKSGHKIRVTGAGHSWSPIACSGDILVNLDLYDEVLAINKEKGTVRVQAGIRLKQLNRILEENGMALINLGSVSEQSVAGATATGTHGTGIGFQVISSAIIGMRVIDARGEVAEINSTDTLLDAYRVSIGLLGIITEVELKCSPIFNLREESGPMVFDKAMDRLPDLLRENDHVKFWWFPHVERLMVYRFQRTQEPFQQQSPFLKWIEGVLIAKYVFATILRMGAAIPSWIPAINRFIAPLHQKKINRVGKSYDIFNVPMPPRHRESEYAVPVEKAAAALRELRDEIERCGLKVNFVTEIRFVKGDSIWLSPAYGRDSCYIGGYLYGDNRWQSYFDLFERIMKKYDGRPHWGKEFTPELTSFRKEYPRFGDFAAHRQRVDPDGMFVNSFLEKIFN